MLRVANGMLLLSVLVGALFVTVPEAQAQSPVVVTAYQPAVTYLPERRGLFGQRLVYRPAVVAAPAPAVVAAPAPAVRYYAPAPVVTSYRVVTPRYYAAPVVVAPRVRAYYAPIYGY